MLPLAVQQIMSQPWMAEPADPTAPPGLPPPLPALPAEPPALELLTVPVRASSPSPQAAKPSEQQSKSKAEVGLIESRIAPGACGAVRPRLRRLIC
jgi:hypothetical protein